MAHGETLNEQPKDQSPPWSEPPGITALYQETRQASFKSIILFFFYVGCLLAVLGTAGLLGYAAWARGVMPLPQAAFLMTVIVLTGASFILFVRSLESEGRLSVEPGVAFCAQCDQVLFHIRHLTRCGI